MKGRIYHIFFVLVFLSSSYKGITQTSSFIAGGIDDFIRNNQLLGNTGLQNSFTIRSLSRDISVVDSFSIGKINEMEELQLINKINRLEQGMLRLEANNYEILSVLKNILVSIDASHKQ